MFLKISFSKHLMNGVFLFGKTIKSKASYNRIKRPKRPFTYLRIKIHRPHSPIVARCLLLGVSEFPCFHLGVKLLDDILLTNKSSNGFGNAVVDSDNALRDV